jgi:hypothetical protein
MRRLVVLLVLFSAASVGTAGVPAGAVMGASVHAGVPRVVPAKKHKSKPKTVTFTVSGAFQG